MNPKDKRGEGHYGEIEQEPYKLSSMLCTALGVESHQRDVLPLVSAHMLELAELFWRESRQLSGQSTAQKLQEWCVRNFGRALDTASFGTLLFEVRAHGQYAGNKRTLALYESIGEQRRFEMAVAAAERRYGEGTSSYLERICLGAGASIGPGVQRMPHAPGRKEWERRQNEQKAELIAREPGEEG